MKKFSVLVLISLFWCTCLSASEDSYLTQARQLYDAGKFTEMQNVLLQGLQENPDSPELYYNLGVAYIKQNRPKPAVRSYERALQLKPGLKDARMALASLYLDSGQFSKAMTQFKQLMATESNNPVLAEKLGILYYNQKKFTEAVTYFNKAIEISPTMASGVYNYLGMAYFRQGDKPNAIESLNKARSASVLTTDGQRLLALLLLDAGRNDEAIGVYTELTAAGQANIDDYNNLGTAYSRKEDYENAITVYKKVLALNPKHTTAMQNLGLALLKLEEYEQAEVVWRKYVNLSPKDAAAYFNLGVVREKQQKYRPALTAYQKAKELGYLDSAQVDKAIDFLSQQKQVVSPNND
jgi:tetratricopeptide (TPR) repeat protein